MQHVLIVVVCLVTNCLVKPQALLNIPLNAVKAFTLTADPEVIEHFIQLNLK